MALELTRRVGDKIFIGNDIVLTVVSIDTTRASNHVRLGIEAPQHKKILRKELIDDTTPDVGRDKGDQEV